MCSSRVDMTSSSPVYLRALPAGAFETWIIENHHMAALLADKPARALQHRPEAVAQHAIWTSNNFVSHFGPSVLSLSGSIRQFDPVGMLPIPFVFLGKDFFEPICLPVGDRFIHECRRMIDDEVVAACVAP
jgi:hypothetical protein